MSARRATSRFPARLPCDSARCRGSAPCSPIFNAVSGSTHGYDVTDANDIEPVLGGRAGFDRLTESLASAGMG
ncbi:hypothetical protein ACC811_37025, partial [Rhizobium ruizarguesonis]